MESDVSHSFEGRTIFPNKVNILLILTMPKLVVEAITSCNKMKQEMTNTIYGEKGKMR